MIQLSIVVKFEFTPMLPGSTCGPDSICYRDQCVSKSTLDPAVLKEQIVDDFGWLSFTQNRGSQNSSQNCIPISG